MTDTATPTTVRCYLHQYHGHWLPTLSVDGDHQALRSAALAFLRGWLACHQQEPFPWQGTPTSAGEVVTQQAFAQGWIARRRLTITRQLVGGDYGLCLGCLTPIYVEDVFKLLTPPGSSQTYVACHDYCDDVARELLR